MWRLLHFIACDATWRVADSSLLATRHSPSPLPPYLQPSYTMHAGRSGLGLSRVCEAIAAAMPTATPRQRAPTRDFSTSLRADAGTRGKDSATPPVLVKAGMPAEGLAAPPVLVKAGHSEWCTFKHGKVTDMDRSDLLEALANSQLFGIKLKDVDLSGCNVSVFKLSRAAGTDEPTAADEADANKFVELKGTKTVGDTAGIIGVGDHICIRVRLPDTAAATLVAAGPAEGA